MSETIDEIEDVLMRKTEEIRDKFDVMAPVRERPLQTLGMIFGAGLALGLLTGGGGGDDDDEDQSDEGDDGEMELEDDEAEEAWARAEAWEDRAHRLLRVARAQEAELEIHRSRRAPLLDRLASRYEIEEDEDIEDDLGGHGFFDRIREGAAERISSIVSEVMQRIMRGG